MLLMLKYFQSTWPGLWPPDLPFTTLQSLPTHPVLALAAPADSARALPADAASTGRHHPAVLTGPGLGPLTGPEVAPSPQARPAQHGGQLGGHQDGEQQDELGLWEHDGWLDI